MPIDYSKWKNIEVSDDEDDTHPNIDNASLFRWRHQARVERMKEMAEKKKTFAEEKAQAEAKLKSLRERLEKEGLETEALEKAQKDFEEAKNKFDEIEKEERLQPWNVDTISKDGWDKTIINKPQKIQPTALTEEEKEKRYKEFIAKYESKVKEFGMLSKWDDCKKFLLNEPNLCCEETANYLTLWCLNLEIDEKHSLMEHVAKQAIAMQYMLELAKQLDVDVRGCISSFFTRIQQADEQYLEAFNAEIEAFKDRIRTRAKVRIEAAMKQVEEEERKARIAASPGGLDPIEVLESLPADLRECFESQDIAKLQEVVAKMNEEDAKYHIKRCIDSGLWVPDSKAQASESGDTGETSGTDKGAAGEIYEQVDDSESS